MEPYELIIYVIGLLTAIVGLVRFVFTMLKRAGEREAALRAALEKELRADNQEQREAASRAYFRIGKLEEQRTADLALIEDQKGKIEELTGQVGTLLSQMATMQETMHALQDKLDVERRENERLGAENKRLEKQNADLFEANKLLKNDNKTMRDMVALLGLRLAEDKPDPPTTPGPTAPDSAPNEFSKLPKAA